MEHGEGVHWRILPNAYKRLNSISAVSVRKSNLPNWFYETKIVLPPKWDTTEENYRPVYFLSMHVKKSLTKY